MTVQRREKLLESEVIAEVFMPHWTYKGGKESRSQVCSVFMNKTNVIMVYAQDGWKVTIIFEENILHYSEGKSSSQ
jgi:hypothetical protein